MTLNIDEIAASRIIEDLNPEHLMNASYDMSTKTIIDMKGDKHIHYKLPPQGMAIVVFKERLKLDKTVIGFANVKTTLTQKGIMATNIGIIDPGYDGYLSTLLINFGSSPYILHEDDSYLRLTFNRIDGNYAAKTAPKISIDEYTKNRQSDTNNLSEKFLNLSSVNEEVFRRVMKSLIGLGIIFSAGSFAVGMYFQTKTAKEKDQDKIVKSYDIQNTLLVKQNNQLQLSIDSITKALKISDQRLKKLEK